MIAVEAEHVTKLTAGEMDNKVGANKQVAAALARAVVSSVVVAPVDKETRGNNYG